MNDPISVDFWVEELTKDTNLNHFDFSKSDFDYTTYTRNYGEWMWNCGYNAGLVNLQTKVNTYCVPQWVSVKDRLPTSGDPVMVTTGNWGDKPDVCSARLWTNKDGSNPKWCDYYGADVESMMGASVTHWRPLPTSPKENNDD